MVDVKRSWDRVFISKEHTDSYVKSPKPVPVRGRTTVYVKDNSVSHSYSRLLMGRRRDNGKLFSRWQTSDMHVVRRTSSGRVAFMVRTPDAVYGGPTHFRPMLSLDGRETLDFYTDAVENQLGIRSIADIYPVFKNLGAMGQGDFSDIGLVASAITEMRFGARGLNPKRYPMGGSSWRFARAVRKQSASERRLSRDVYSVLHNDDPTRMVELLTGHKYRKDILRALRGLSLNGVSGIHNLSDIEPDFVAKAIQAESTIYYTSWQRRVLVQRMFNEGMITRHTFLRLMESVDFSTYEIVDLRRMLGTQMNHAESRAFMRNRSVTEAHDELGARAAAVRDSKIKEPIKYSDCVAKIDGARVGKYKIVLPKNGVEIQKWGHKQGHCIGSYATDAYKYAVLGAVFDGDSMVANFHLSEVVKDPASTFYRMVQIYGKHNGRFEGAQEIHDYLVKQKVIIKSPNAGGMPVQLAGAGQYMDLGYANMNGIQMGEIRADRIAGMQPGNHFAIGGVVGEAAPIF